MNFPVDAPWLSIEGTKTARVVSMHGADTFTAVFRFYNDAFFKFKVKLARVHPPSDHVYYITRNRLFELITGASNADTVTWRKRDFEDYFNSKPTYLTMNCIHMDKYGFVHADIGDFADVLVREKLAHPIK
jgi:hypothetical protein